MTMLDGATTERSLRADALRNRNRIIEVARDTFAEIGIDVPMAEIARRAGVGVATLYRRFPTKESLISESFTEQLRTCIEVIDEALADPDPWHGFCTFVERICAIQTADRGFTAAYVSEFPDAHAFDEARARAERGFAELTRRAKDAGCLRPDFDAHDLALVIMANGGVIAEAGEIAPVASRRLVAYLLQAFRARPDGPSGSLPPAAPVLLSPTVHGAAN